MCALGIGVKSSCLHFTSEPLFIALLTPIWLLSLDIPVQNTVGARAQEQQSFILRRRKLELGKSCLHLSALLSFGNNVLVVIVPHILQSIMKPQEGLQMFSLLFRLPRAPLGRSSSPVLLHIASAFLLLGASWSLGPLQKIYRWCWKYFLFKPANGSNITGVSWHTHGFMVDSWHWVLWCYNSIAS